MPERRVITGRRAAAFNTLSDPAVLMSLGSGLMALPVSGEAAAVSFGRTGVALATRLVREFHKAQRPLTICPAWFKSFALNKGAPLIINGMLSGVSAAAAFWAAARHGGQAGYDLASGLGSLAVSSVLFGVGASLERRKTLASLMGATAYATGAIGLFFLAPSGTPLLLYGGYAVSAGLSAWLAFQGKATGNGTAIQPELAMSAACLATAALSYSQGLVYPAVANFCFSAAFISMDALKKHNGLAEAAHNGWSGLKSALKPGAP